MIPINLTFVGSFLTLIFDGGVVREGDGSIHPISICENIRNISHLDFFRHGKILPNFVIYGDG